MIFTDKIASFQVNHDTLMPGVYISRVDGDITTYDLRFIKPNTPPFLSSEIMHSIEHLFATLARNSEYKDKIIYFGPMGCRTGFYLLVRDMSEDSALKLIKDTVLKIVNYSGEIPGLSPAECGNYLEHDKKGALKAADVYAEVIKKITVNSLKYK